MESIPSAEKTAARNGSRQKKAILINDLSGFGRCSLSVELPVLSVMQIECLLLPTSLLSNHTGYTSFYLHDLSADMDPFLKEWQKEQVEADAIMTGFLSSSIQIEHVQSAIRLFKKPDTLLIVDPVLGDDGKAYSTITQPIIDGMKQLAFQAGLLLPNLTEACLLCGADYDAFMSRQQIEQLARRLQKQGAGQVVITGIEQAGKICECLLEADGKISWLEHEKTGSSRAGTGDLFCAVTGGALLNGAGLKEAVTQAAAFVRAALKETERLHVPVHEGTAFERVLCLLCPCAQENGS